MPRIFAWPLKLALLFGLFVVYWVVNAEGLRNIAPFLGRKLSKVPLPGFSYLADYEGLHQLDTAHVVTVFLFVASLISCTQFVRCLLIGEVSRPNGVTLNYGTYKFVVLALSVVILFADGFLFYYGTFSRTTSLFSDDTGVSLTALVLTAGYCVTLFCMAFWAVRLEIEHQY